MTLAAERGVDANHASATFSRYSPVNGSVVATYPNQGLEETRAAIATARKAFDSTGWATAPARDRAKVLQTASNLMLERVDDFATWIAREAGKPMKMSRSEVVHSAHVIAHYAALAADMKGEAITQQVPDAVGLVVHEPIGAVGIITPWNFPLSLVARKVAPALAAGCTIVAKPSHFTPKVTLMLRDLLIESGMPPEVFSVVTSDIDNGALVGQEIAGSTQLDMVAFTGSTEAGKAVARAATSNVKRVALELGGKSPNIVFADADIDDALRGAYTGIYLNSGQVCQAGTRLLVQRDIKDEFVSRLVDMSKKIRMGDPLDSQTEMGPLVNEKQLARVQSYVERGMSEAKLVYRGEAPKENGLERGLFVPPTIFDEVDSHATIAQEEIFGPVLSVLTFDTTEDAIRLANETMYGLAAAVWTTNINTAFEVTKAIRAGTVWVNAYHATSLNNMPYGGYGQSGLGRELGHQGLHEYLETKSIQIQLPRKRR
ncbi:MAG TPA: aldehyde dehydrogenase family protein [Tepidiformaceae bacterium]|nr:aldehyde dehydrogenase family protein [Tepidiformaceae bacterium]